MPIHLITGIPGHGKTARMVSMLMDDAEKGDRPLFAAGIDGLAPGLAVELDDPREWEKLPDGAKIYIDEAWKWFGHLHNASRQATPPHVLALAEHRHRGFDFVMTSQGINQLYPFMRPLVAPHEHVVRKMGTHVVDVYRWGEAVEDVKSQGIRDRAEKSVSTLPKRTFDNYKSASQHTIKPRLPWRLALIPACLLAAVVLCWFTWQMLSPDAVAADVEEAATAGSPAAPLDAGEGGSARGEAPMSGQEWLARLTPRFPGMPESAPVFDEREVVAVPRRFCVISGTEGVDQRCNCYTEQMTPIRDVSAGVCLQVARWGEYDHFRPPPGERRGGHLEAAPSANSEPAPVVGITTPPTAVGSPDGGKVQGV